MLVYFFVRTGQEVAYRRSKSDSFMAQIFSLNFGSYLASTAASSVPSIPAATLDLSLDHHTS